MKLSVNLTPKIMTAPKKDALVNKIKGSRCWTSTQYGMYLSAINQKDSVRVYNLEKRRRVVKRSVNSRNLQVTEVVSPNHWVAFVYDIPVELIKLTRQKVIQGNRTFWLQKF